MSVQVSRDPFARQSLVREVVKYHAGTGCKECGGTNGNGYLFHYGVQPDSLSGRVNWSPGLFCSVGCYRQYNS